MKIGWFKFRSY